MIKRLFQALTFVIAVNLTYNLAAMERGGKKRKRQETSKTDVTKLLELTSDTPEKKEKICSEKETLEWVDAQITGTGEQTLHPIIQTVKRVMHVDPIVAAVYNDDLSLLQKCIYTQKFDILQCYQDIIEDKKEANIFEIAAAQGSYDTLKYLIQFAQSLEPFVGKPHTVLPLELLCIYSFNTYAYNNGKASDYEWAACQRPEFAQEVNRLHNLKYQLRSLLKKSYRSALALAKNNEHIETATLVCSLNKKNQKTK